MVDAVKASLERTWGCRGVVSCADILALVARDAVAVVTCCILMIFIIPKPINISLRTKLILLIDWFLFLLDRRTMVACSIGEEGWTHLEAFRG